MNTIRPSNWRLFPWVLCGMLGVTFLVNGVMVWRAISTHPGVATQAMFDASNRYDQVLAEGERQVALGWQLTITAPQGRPEISLASADGKPIEGARIQGVAQRPAGGQADVVLAFRATAPGRYVAETALPISGQWDVLASAHAGGKNMRATHRVIVP